MTFYCSSIHTSISIFYLLYFILYVVHVIRKKYKNIKKKMIREKFARTQIAKKTPSAANRAIVDLLLLLMMLLILGVVCCHSYFE